MSLKGTSHLERRAMLTSEARRTGIEVDDVHESDYLKWLEGNYVEARVSAARAKRSRTQRNALLVLSVILILACAVMAFFAMRRPATSVTAEQGTSEAHTAESGPYVASVSSDMFHKDTCPYAENIAERNRVYYEAAGLAKTDGRIPCSQCFPDGKITSDFLQGMASGENGG